ncbi:MAG: hypothetical protein IAE82_01340 [Opitutaceae bacterium]|nr:hypothetical protein [Opitutaceae bacterium]
MATETPAPPARKHRVVALGTDPAAAPRKAMPRWLIITASIVGLLLVVLTVRVIIVLRELERARSELTAAGGASAADPSVAFANRSRAESARQAAMRSIESAGKIPSQHPTALQMMVEVERLRDPADKAFGDRDYAKAIQLFEEISRRADTYTAAMEDMRKAQDGYANFLLAIARLQKFRPLAPDKFELALTAAGASQQFLDQGSFGPARQQIDEAMKTLGAVEESIKAELELKLAEGRTALAQGSGQAASTAFERALELQPENEIAAQGLARAKTIDRVFAMLADADRFEAAGKLEEARDLFAKTFELDGQSAAAQAGVSRTKAAIKKRDFDSARARATAAAAENRWTDAIAAYVEAQKVEPDNEEVKKLLAESRVREREQRVQDMLKTAYDAERQYAWADARRVYLELLAFQPGQTEAEEGLLRTGKVTRALLKFERLLEDARSLAARADFQAAINSFNEAMASKPAYLELQLDQIELKEMLERQSKPVSIAFVSDGKTWVTISGLQLLGKFTTTSVNILPGNYEVIGRRKGYADVREVIRVRAGEAIEPVTIIATKRAAN